MAQSSDIAAALLRKNAPPLINPYSDALLAEAEHDAVHRDIDLE